MQKLHEKTLAFSVFSSEDSLILDFAAGPGLAVLKRLSSSFEPHTGLSFESFRSSSRRELDPGTCSGSVSFIFIFMAIIFLLSSPSEAAEIEHTDLLDIMVRAILAANNDHFGPAKAIDLGAQRALVRVC